MVGVSIRKHSSRAGFHHQVHGPEYWYLRRGAGLALLYFHTVDCVVIILSLYKSNFGDFKDFPTRHNQTVLVALVNRQTDVDFTVHTGYQISTAIFYIFFVFEILLVVRGKVSLILMQKNNWLLYKERRL